jgi:drug/metabolite transporter (DMT)-like permease
MLLLTSGRLLPEEASTGSYYYLIISGIIGLSIGDLCLFSAFVMIGTRLTLLIFAVSPIMAALIAWVMLAERLGLVAIAGIAITVAGIVWVTAERQADPNNRQFHGRKWQGVVLALCGAAGQAAGLVLAKVGMGETVEPLQATFIRMIAAAAAVWLFGFLKGDNSQTLRKVKDSRAMVLALGGAIGGPFLGVWLSLIAVKYTETGIAAAIMATVPVLVIPLVIIFYKEKVSIRAFIGAVITAGGVALFFIR